MKNPLDFEWKNTLPVVTGFFPVVTGVVTKNEKRQKTGLKHFHLLYLFITYLVTDIHTYIPQNLHWKCNYKLYLTMYMIKYKLNNCSYSTFQEEYINNIYGNYKLNDCIYRFVLIKMSKSTPNSPVVTGVVTRCSYRKNSSCSYRKRSQNG